MNWTVRVVRPALWQLDDLPANIRRTVQKHIDQLSRDPFRTNIIKMRGTESGYRVRVGNYRIILEIDTAAGLVIVHQIGHRRDVYR